MPIEPEQLGTDPHLRTLLSSVLERDPARRTGASSGAAEVRASPFFERIEWALLLGKRLPAPWRPDPNLVYAKDFITPLSNEGQQQTAGGALQPQPGSPLPPPGMPQPQLQGQTTPPADTESTAESWDYVCDQAAFAEELSEYAFKRATAQARATGKSLLTRRNGFVNSRQRQPAA